MPRIFLQDIIKDVRFEDLPANWNSFDKVLPLETLFIFGTKKDALKEYRRYWFDEIEKMVDDIL